MLEFRLGLGFRPGRCPGGWSLAAPCLLTVLCHGKVVGRSRRWMIEEGPVCSLIPNWGFFVFDWKGFVSMTLALGDVGVKRQLKAYSSRDQAGVVARSML